MFYSSSVPFIPTRMLTPNLDHDEMKTDANAKFTPYSDIKKNTDFNAWRYKLDNIKC